MTDAEFSMPALMDILVQKLGLSEAARTDDTSLTFSDVGLDSLAFLQLQTEVKDRYGFDLPDEADTYTFGDMVALVAARPAEGVSK